MTFQKIYPGTKCVRKKDSDTCPVRATPAALPVKVKRRVSQWVTRLITEFIFWSSSFPAQNAQEEEQRYLPGPCHPGRHAREWQLKSWLKGLSSNLQPFSFHSDSIERQPQTSFTDDVTTGATVNIPPICCPLTKQAYNNAILPILKMPEIPDAPAGCEGARTALLRW